MKINRVVLIILDSVGIGALPDAHMYDDEGSNTLGNIAKHSSRLNLPNLTSLGLGNIDMHNELSKTDNPKAAYGKAIEKSSGKDTTTGHWEICGVVLDKPFPTFPNGFPKAFINKFEQIIGTSVIGNKPASGTTIINELGPKHLATKSPIVYTSADSVFQIAMHESIYSIAEQYRICEIARTLLQGDLKVGRVIARPFVGEVGNFIRTKNRKDFSVPPPTTLLDVIQRNKIEVRAIGKIIDIFSGKGISHSIKTANNKEGIKATINTIANNTNKSLIFTNLVDFDVHFGHRRDVEGYAKALMEFDTQLPNILDALKDDDLLIVTADHGNDPTAPGTDHTREFIPIIAHGKMVTPGKNIGIRQSFSDIGATIAEAFNIDFDTVGKSFYSEILNTKN